MRRLVCLAAILALVWSGNSPADDQADMKALVNKAIKAAGGAEKLAMFKGITFKEKGTYYGMGQGVEFTGEWSEQMPDKMRHADRRHRRQHEDNVHPCGQWRQGLGKDGRRSHGDR